MTVQPAKGDCVNVYGWGMCEHEGHGQVKWYVHEELGVKICDEVVPRIVLDGFFDG